MNPERVRRLCRKYGELREFCETWLLFGSIKTVKGSR